MKERFSIGVDIIEIKRFGKKPLNKNKRFYHSIFSESELTHCTKYGNPYPHLAGIFAAKEAIIKCMGKTTGMSNIEIKWDSYGKPSAFICDDVIDVKISISHTNGIAIAFALIAV